MHRGSAKWHSKKILNDMKEAMKNKDELRLRVLRSVKSAIGYFEVEGEKR